MGRDERTAERILDRYGDGPPIEEPPINPDGEKSDRQKWREGTWRPFVNETYRTFWAWEALMLRAAGSFDEYQSLMEAPLPEVATWWVKKQLTRG